MAGWLFLVASLTGAALVWNVHRPMPSGIRIGFASFFLGWLEAELALHHIVWQAIATIAFILAGALATTPGKIALGVTLLSWVALAWHWMQGFAVADVMQRALEGALGSDEMRMESEPVASLARVDWRAIAAPFPIRSEGVERIRDVVYARAGGQDLKLDVYRSTAPPDPARERRPVFFYVHGGGWVLGTKNTQGLPLCHHVAARGWICVNVNYRLSPHATFPEHLIDLKRALAWVRTKGQEFGCDPDFIVTAGGSAGGHLAALLALTPGDSTLQPGFEDADTSVQGCVPIYGVYDFSAIEAPWRHREFLPFLERHVMKARFEDAPERFRAASPVHRVTPNAPPFLVVHGQKDSLVPVGEARAFVEVLRRTSKEPVAYAEIPGAQHAFELFPSLRSDLARQGIERFLESILSAHGEGATS